MSMEPVALTQMQRLIKIIERLLDPEKGCPWDLKQTHESLLPYLLEEAYEFINAVEKKDFLHMEEELGDVLLQILLHARMAEKENKFSLEGVAGKLADKLIYRHPHVFQDPDQNLSSDEVLANWDKLKQEKKKEEGKEERYQINESYLIFPALQSALKIGKKTSKLAFDWDNPSQVLYKVEEEWQEIKEELPPSGEYNRDRVSDEIGDLLFSIVQLARHLDVNPEDSLRKSNKKFVERFNLMEDMLANEMKGRHLKDLSDEQKEQLWMRAKIQQKEKSQRERPT